MECTDKLEQLHKRAIRKIEFCQDYMQKGQYDAILKSFDLTSLYQRRAEHLLTFIYKFKGDIVRIDPQKAKIELQSKNKLKLKSEFTSKTKVQNGPLNRGIFLWDQLPDMTQTAPTLSQFKNKVQNHINHDQLVYCGKKLY